MAQHDNILGRRGINKMEKNTIIAVLVALLTISGVVAGAYVQEKYEVFKFIETSELSVLRDGIINGNLRVNGLSDLEGPVKITNNCVNNDGYVMVNSQGLIYVMCAESKN